METSATLPPLFEKVQTKEKVVAVLHTSIDIPNDGLHFSPSVPETIRAQIVDALLAMAETDEGQETLYTAFWCSGLQKVDDSFYDPLRQLLDASGVDIESLQ